MEPMNKKGNRFRNSELKASIYALVGSERNSISVTDDSISGRCGDFRGLEEREIRNALESLLNSRLTTDELRVFVAKYGPLGSRRAKSGDVFEEPVEAWRRKQKWLREFWTLKREARSWTQVSGEDVIITMTPGHASLRFNSLSPAMDACLSAVPDNHLGECANPDCATPYFFKRRPTETYCGNSVCSRYGQRLAKRTWWSKHGKDSKPTVTKAPSKRRKKK